MNMKTKTIIAGAALVICGTVTAGAADFDRSKLVRAPSIQAPSTPTAKPIAYSWSGYYVGGNFGYTWGDSNFDTSIYDRGVTLPSSQSAFDSKGMMFGLQLGANHQFDNNLVFGVESDVSWADIKGEFNYDNGRPGAVAGTKFDAVATARARIGYAFDRFLPYATGGLAVGHGKAYINNVYSAAGEYTSGSEFTVGWTAGAGLEYAVDNNISLKAEYLHTNFPSVSYWMALPAPSSSTRINDDASFNTMKLGVNWKLN